MVSVVNTSDLRLTSYRISNSQKNKISFPTTLAAKSYGRIRLAGGHMSIPDAITVAKIF